MVRATSPTLVTPTIGVATATSVNKLTFTQPATGSTLTLIDGKTLTVNNTVTLTGTDSSSYNLDKLDSVPQNSQSDNYTLVIGDAGKHIYETGSGKTVTVPANASVAFTIGTTVVVVAGSNSVSIAITSDTMYLAGSGTTGTRTLAAYGVATLLKVAATTWYISGAGVS